MGGMAHGTNWLPPLVVLGIGLLVGLVLALRTARGRRAGAATRAVPLDDVEVRDLRVELDQRLAQLRELDDTADKRTAEELARARHALELEAARVLLALEAAERRAAQAAAGEAAPPAAAPASRSPAWVGALWGGGTVGFAALLFFVLQGQIAQRAPGGSITGNDVSVNGPGGQAQAPRADPELEALFARAKANPQDLDAQLDLAQALLQRERLVDVFMAAQAAREIDPDNPRALTYEAVVRHAMGQGEIAMQLFDKALRRDPALAEGWVRRGLVAFDLARYDDAVTSWEKALELRPDGKAALQPVIDEARLRARGAPSGGAAAAPGAAGAPAAAPAAPVPGEAAGGGFRLVLELDPALAGQVAPGTPIFVAVRQAGVKAGPPAAVKRLVAGAFPMQVAIGPGDTMMGQPLPASAYVEARVDADGNAMTRSPSDPTASADGVAQGSELRLVLRVQ